MESQSPDVDTPDLSHPGLDRSAVSPDVDLGPPRDDDHFADPGCIAEFPTPEWKA